MQNIKGLKRILFCTDFSASVDEAFGYACGIARASGGWIVVMHVVTSTYEEPEDASFMTPDRRMQIDDGIRGRVQRELHERYTAQCPADTPCETLIVKGNPAEKILEVAAKENIDLIIQGSRGRTAMGDLFLGSVAQRVGQSSRVPVLLVPASL